MPSIRDEEPRRRKKDYDRDSSSRISHASHPSHTSRSRDRHHSSRKPHRRRSSTSRDGSPVGSTSRLERSSHADLGSKSGKKVTMLVPEMERRSSIGTHSSSYPSFSKEHSREAVRSREDVPSSRPTGARSENDAPAVDPSRSTPPSRAPPSPPLTEEEKEAKRADVDRSKRRTTDKLKAEARASRKGSSDGLRPSSSTASSQKKSSSHRQRLSSDDSDSSDVSDRSPNKSKYSDSTGVSKKTYKTERTSEERASTITQQTQDSQATEKKPSHHPSALDTTEERPPLPPQPSPRAPHSAHHSANPSSASQNKGPYDYYDATTASHALHQSHGMHPPPIPSSRPSSMPPPPAPSAMPPPPPPIIPPEVNPRVDYLLENGGLPRPIPRSFLPRVDNQGAQNWSVYASPRMNQGSAPNDLVQLFAPVHARLDDYLKVMDKSGSIAVATGYRSVARRLLDRVATVFAREISNEKCHCVMCTSMPSPDVSEEEEKGISWGEILEFTAGRRELPQWPPFTMSGESGGLGITNAEPMQEVDPDVPPEWRTHYLRQNAKTKRAVEGWLLRSSDDPTSAPAEIDDETLTFAITTHIEPERRPLFIALRKGMSNLPPAGAERSHLPKNDVLTKVSLALQRLYRLSSPPREAECCLYLLNNQYLHNTLATIAAVTDGEWDILISGRFDGFLISGAETQMPSSSAYYGSGINISRGPSRGPTATPLSPGPTPFAPGGAPSQRGGTPFSPLRNEWSGVQFPSRNGTPAPLGSAVLAPAPVQVDEDTEISVLAEIERDILRGMDYLEDQFEKLHYQAEAVRERLRARATGLTLTAKARRGSLASEPGVRLASPVNGLDGRFSGLAGPWTPDLQEGTYLDDGRSELAPDDSASQIGYGSRKHRRDGRSSRAARTPAPVVEEDEGRDTVGDDKDRKSGSFRRRR
ncbi:hypothetical protein AAFC00_003831 [Neodothiora populina]|uniref:Uncharacterized protein n=1 Tax=Neodothiora populina TaxID=2781224 RepID=A0ABR3PFJ6_9PEZI